MSRVCCYVLTPASAGKAALYCGKPTRYSMAPDGGEPGAAKVRKYDSFCPEHRKIVDVMPDEDEDTCPRCHESYDDGTGRCLCLAGNIQ